MVSRSPKKRRTTAYSRTAALVGMLVVLAVAVFAVIYVGGGGSGLLVHPDQMAQTRADSRLAVAKPVSRRPAENQFVGSEKCAECHDEIAEQYATHTMSFSLAEVPDDRGVEKIEQTVVRPGGRCVYKVKRDENGWQHAETAIDDSGNVIYEQWFPIDLAIGSGIRGRTYLTNRNGIIFQSPISWFSGVSKWDLSPGYMPDDPRRFDRRIVDDCLACHSGRIRDLPESNRRFGTPVVVEAMIGCERCHGAGLEHVEYQEGDDSQGDDPILQVASLDSDRQNALCYQCHLVGAARIARYGMNVWDFQPGDRFSDVFVSFVHPSNTVDNPTKAVSQVAQMEASKCFQESGRKLLCATCHDPHLIPPENEKPLWYRKRCLTCHTETSCELKLEDRKRHHANDACTECHMPTVAETDVAHTVQTDHRIVRRPGKGPPTPDWTTRFGLAFFDYCDRDLPEWEFKRSLALALDAELAIHYNPAQDTEMEKLLVSVLPYVPDDADVLMALARAATRRNDARAAEKYYRQGLKAHPRHEGFLGGLGMVCQDTGRPKEALEFLDRLIKINPWDAGTHGVRADSLRKLGQMDEAILAIERALELNPRLPNGREWLIEAYRQTGRSSEARRQLEILRRLHGS